MRRGEMPQHGQAERGRLPAGAQGELAPDAVFFGPWYGEFGHAIMWAAMCRAQAAGKRRVIVCARPNEKALFADFATSFIPHDIVCEGMCAGATPRTEPAPERINAYCPTGVKRSPAQAFFGRSPARYHKYGTPKPEYDRAIVLHARHRAHVSMRNWGADRWNRLARWLLDRVKIPRLICIGSKEAALAVEGALDMRGADLAEQMNVLASARCCIGPSSGPMHLAQHSGCPVLVWCGGGPSERREVRLRYASTWNPFQTFAHAYEYASWQPTYETVHAWTYKFLEALCARSHRNAG